MTTPRLPPLPDLDWKPDGTPVAKVMDDVYFSIEDGLEEARAVFLAGCGLPERWARREQFTVAELGFGTGLNLLALWKLWHEHRPQPEAKLDFVSFEGALMKRADAARALLGWRELQPFTDRLLDNWPVRARGVQQIKLTDGITLTLHIDDIAAALPNSLLKADAWFLDGFAPAKNESMWAPDIYPLIMARSNPGAKVGTYTVAGAVRRGLQDAGFSVSKQPGFGSKRDRLEAIAPTVDIRREAAYSFAGLPTKPRKVAIVGAGIAGACLAHSFNQKRMSGRTEDLRITLFDKAKTYARGASGNRLALIMPRLDAADTGPARALVASYLFARRFYLGLPGVHPVGVEQRPRNDADRARFEKLQADPPFDSDLLQHGANGGLNHDGAMILEPREIIMGLLNGFAIEAHKFDQACRVDFDRRTVDGEAFDLIVLANGMGLKSFDETRWMLLEGKLGQVDRGQAETDLTAAIASGHYALALGKERLWGATFTTATDDKPLTSAAASKENDDALKQLISPDWGPIHRKPPRAGIRATTPDKLPLAGLVPNFSKCLEAWASLRNGVEPDVPAPVHEGIWCLGGLGARGFTFAPWLAEHLAATAFGLPSPVGKSEVELVSPARFIYRGLKRKVF